MAKKEDWRMVKIKRFNEISGTEVEMIDGQSQIGYSIDNDGVDFYDMTDCMQVSDFAGSELTFYDYYNAKVYKPFQKRKNVLYGYPLYHQDCFWFLQGDFELKVVTLYQYPLGEIPQEVVQFAMDKVNLYNLRILGEGVHVVSVDDELQCYYPEPFSFMMDQRESIELIDEGKVYLTAWIEEGWDEVNHCPATNYHYYDKVIVRDFKGKLLSEEVGSLKQHVDGTWWIS